MTQAASRSWTGSTTGKKSSVPEGTFLRCPACSQLVYRRAMEANQSVCPECDHHFRVSASERVRLLSDVDTFRPMFTELRPKDPLQFQDLKPYSKRLVTETAKSGVHEGATAGSAFIKGRAVMLCCLDVSFMMGSMGSVVGELVTRSVETAIDRDTPLVVVSASGGARMQESGLSLMQMAKASAALARLDDSGGLFISVLTDPTTGGVSASFAMLGDVILAEPKALIGFAGPRVIQQTIRQQLPEGFQRSEYLQEAGMVDRVVHRHALRSEIARVIDYAGK